MQTVRRLEKQLLEWGKKGDERTCAAQAGWGHAHPMLRNPKTPSRQVKIYLVFVSLHSVLSLQDASLPVLPFFLHIYTQRCCVMLVLFGEWRFFSHHPAYGCFSRVPVCVCVCGKVRLLMIVDTRDTVPYHSSCTMGCSWSRPTMKTSIRSRTGMRPLEPVWKVAFGLVASVHFCRLIVIVWARVHAWRICSQRKTGLALGWRLNLQETACLTPKVLPQVSVNADYVIGYINTWFLCTKRSSFGCIWVH